MVTWTSWTGKRGEQKKPSKALGCFGCLVLTPVLGFGGIAATAWLMKRAVELAPEPVPWQEADHTIAAYQRARDVIKAQLKSPSTADFPGAIWDDALNHVKRSGTTYRINSYVDAQNSFGATVRTRYSVTLERTGPDAIDDWTVLEATLIE